MAGTQVCEDLLVVRRERAVIEDRPLRSVVYEIDLDFRKNR
ncbi:MAG: hypothetical protein ABGZ17_00360 [Planctomycetaceae bacterium]